MRYLSLFTQKDILLTNHDVERILTKYIHVHTIPEYSQEEKAEYKGIFDSAKNKLSKRMYPFEAIAGGDEKLIILGPVDRFEPYKTANKEKPEAPEWLLTEDFNGRRTIRTASQLRNPDTKKYLIPRRKKPKSTKRISTTFEKFLRIRQGKKLLEEMSTNEILTEVKQYIMRDFKTASKEIKNKNVYTYILDRSCELFDPMSEVYKVILEKYKTRINGPQNLKKCQKIEIL